MNLTQQKKIRVNYAGLTDIGIKRTENQDSFGQYPENSQDSHQPGGLLFIVADGMGGHENGKEASRMAVRIAGEEYYNSQEKETGKSLNRAIQTANAAIFQKASGSTDGYQMGTTISVLAITDEIAHIAHVGDSRIYLIRDGKLIQLTTDHTKVEDLRRAGIINKEEAKNHPERSVLNRALGVKDHVRVDISSDIQVHPGDIFILCTDGLANVTHDELLNISQKETPRRACQKFIGLANERGGHDNSTVQLVKIEGIVLDKQPDEKEKVNILMPLLTALGILFMIFAVTTIYIANNYKQTGSQNTLPGTSTNQNTEEEITVLFNRARNYLNRNQYENALGTYQQILTKNPLDTDALREIEQMAVRFVRQGELFERQGNTGEALNYYRQAFEIRSKDVNLKKIINELEAKDF